MQKLVIRLRVRNFAKQQGEPLSSVRRTLRKQAYKGVLKLTE
jgi:hypothetical protein